VSERALVYGLAITGAAVARALVRHGYEVTVADDHVDADRRQLAAELGVELLPAPTDAGALVRRFDLLSPAPGLPETHPIVVAALAGGVPVVSELELSYRWEQATPVTGRPRPILAVTGTDGKTTTTELTVAMLRAAGLRTQALGNTDVPLVDAVDDPALDAFVVECSSFRLAWTEQFRPDAAVWLNLAPDHLNWHTSLGSYEAAKSRIWSAQRPGDAAIGFLDDPVVMAQLRRAPGRQLTFGSVGADYHADRGRLVGPRGPIAEISTMRRRLPHDITNALAASALVLETGLADAAAIGAALASFEAPPHRLEPVADVAGVRWYNDSKATTPHAAAAAIRAFGSVVLIAGGSRKGVDLSPMGADADRVRAVVAIGEAAPDIHAVFDGRSPVVDAASMPEAVRTAAGLARPGDAVVLSPGCASFDWYTGYPARGDDFRRLVHELVGDDVSDTREVSR
jgi:UDP-N-acetylmuramoylalanine--D-glutamate ligase